MTIARHFHLELSADGELTNSCPSVRLSAVLRPTNGHGENYEQSTWDCQEFGE